MTALLALAAAWGNAQDWGNIAVISDTLGNHAGRLCIGEGLRVSDIGCPTYAPSVSTAGHVSITGNVSAQKFIGDGSLLSGISTASGDRIVSGTNDATRMVAISDTGYISITQAGANSGWFSPYTGLVTLGVSSTGGISGTTGYFSGNVGIGMSATDVTLHVNGIAQLAGSNAQHNNDGIPLTSSTLWLRRGTAGSGNYAGLRLGTNHADGSTYLFGNQTGMLFYTTSGGTSSERMRIAGGGNVGVGIISPTATLQVSGSFTVSTSGQTTTPTIQGLANGGVGMGMLADAAWPLSVRNWIRLESEDTEFNGIGFGGVGGAPNKFYIGKRTGVSSSALAIVYGSGPANSNGLLLSQNGKLGVKTFALADLDVAGTISASGAIQVGTSSLACSAGIPGAMRYSSGNIQFCNGTTWTALGAAGGGLEDRIVSGTTSVIAYEDRSITFSIAGAQRMIVGENGAVGIGLAEPVSGYALSVSGSIYSSNSTPSLANIHVTNFGGNAALWANTYNAGSDAMVLLRTLRSGASHYWNMGSDSSDGNKLKFGQGSSVGSAVAMTIDSSGSVGIGTVTPVATLQVSGTFIVSRTGQTSTPTFYVGTDGVVGIGTTTPTVAFSGGGLEIDGRVGGGSGGAGLRLTNSLGIWDITSPGSNGNLGIYDASNNRYPFYIRQNSGNVGIATTLPNAALQVSGTFTVSKTGQTAQEPSFVVDSDGEVGIGTSAPTAPLHVSGTGQMILLGTSSGIPHYYMTFRDPTVGGMVGFDAGGGMGNSLNSNLRIQGGTNKGIVFDVHNAGGWGTGPGAMFLSAAGNLGIGTSNTLPKARLDVSGTISATNAIQVGQSSLACSSGIPGALRYNASAMQFCNGTTWTTLGSAGAATAASSTGAVQFNVGNALAGDTSNFFWDDANNRLGIGTSTPGYIVHVSGSSPRLAIANGVGSTYAETVLLDETGSAKWSTGIYGDSHSNASLRNGYYIYQYEDASDAMVNKYRFFINDDGNVSVGGSVTPIATLQVSGSFIISTSAQITTPTMIAYDSGTISIGTTSTTAGFPAQVFIGRRLGRVGLTISSVDGSAQSDLVLHSSGNPADGKSLQFVNTATSGGNFYLRVLSDDYLTIKHNLLTATLVSGTLGISNTNPLAKLDVVGTISASDAIQVGQSTLECSVAISGSIRYNVTSNTIQVCTGATGWKSLASSTVAAGSATAASSTGAVQFNVAGDLAGDTNNFFWDDTNNRLSIGTSTPANFGQFYVSGSIGRMGIAAGNPTQFSELMFFDNTPVAKWVLAHYGDSTANTTLRNSFGIYQYRDQSDASVSRYRLFFNDDGNASFGGSVSPTATLQVSGTFTVSNSAQTTTPSLFVGTDGNVAIGTTRPSASLHVTGGAKFGNTGASLNYVDHTVILSDGGTAFEGGLLITNIDTLAGTSVKMSAAFGAGSADLRLGMVSNNAPNTFVRNWIFGEGSNGNVGISQTTPLAKLDVVGTISASDAIQVGSSSLTCSSGISGAIRYNSGSLELCDGTSWGALGGSGGGTALGDRITSGTLAMVVNSATSYVSLSTAGTDWGYLSSAATYLPNLRSNSISATLVSVTNVSATYIQLNSPSTVLACNAGFTGAMRYTSGTMQVCDGSNWGNIGLGVPTGTISAFAATSCPSGWTEYIPSRGRFLRGYDNSAGNDPDGNRAVGDLQDDAMQQITGSMGFNRTAAANPVGAFVAGGTAGAAGATPGSSAAGSIAFNSANSPGARTAAETRPKNVMVIFCSYSGFQSAPGQTILTTLASLTDVNLAGNAVGKVLAYNGGQWVVSNSAAGSDNLGDHTATQDLNITGSYKISFGSTVSDKALWYGNTFGTGIEASTLTNWSGSQFRWRTGGTTASGGTERMLLTTTGLTVTGFVSTTGVIDVGTQVLGNGGDSAATPTYSWTGDTNTGLFTPGADQVGLSTGGAERLRVTNTGLGIGTTAPSTSLYVNGQIGGGFGAVTTAGTLDFNDISNARPGSGYTLLRGSTATNAPNVTASYWHPFSFEYSSKVGSGNLTQFAIPYTAASGMYLRYRTSGTWTGWYRFIVEDASGNATVTNNLTAAAFLYSSDKRLKKNIEAMTGGLAKLDHITPVTFSYISDTTNREHLGVIAQDVQKVYPQAVVMQDDGFLAVDYPALVPVLIDAVKELKADNDRLAGEMKDVEELHTVGLTTIGRLNREVEELRSANDNFVRRLEAVETRKAASR